MRVVAVLALAVMVTVSGCAQKSVGAAGSTRRDTLERLDDQITLQRSQKDNRVLSYGWNGHSYADEATLLAAMEPRISQNLANLTPLPTSLAAGRVVLPDPQKQSGDPSGRARWRLDQARADALRASALFSPLRTEWAGRGQPEAGEGEYLLIAHGPWWELKDGEDRSVPVAVGADLGGFIDNVAAAVKVLAADRRHLRVFKAAGNAVLYDGQSYSHLPELIDAFDRANAALTAQVMPAKIVRGGSARVILPRHPPAETLLLAGETLPLLDAARKAYVLALDRRLARFILAAKVFSSVQVDFADTVDPALGDFDVVLWRAPEAGQWSMKQGTGAGQSLDLSVAPMDFAQKLTVAVTPPAFPALPMMPAKPAT